MKRRQRLLTTEQEIERSFKCSYLVHCACLICTQTNVCNRRLHGLVACRLGQKIACQNDWQWAKLIKSCTQKSKFSKLLSLLKRCILIEFMLENWHKSRCRTERAVIVCLKWLEEIMHFLVWLYYCTYIAHMMFMFKCVFDTLSTKDNAAYLQRTTRMNVYPTHWQAGIHTVRVFPAVLGEIPDHWSRRDWETVGKPTHNVTRLSVDIVCTGPLTSTHHAPHTSQLWCFTIAEMLHACKLAP